MAERTPDLPDFANPPVDETVLSLQFGPIVQLGAPHFGLYWAKIRSEFPKVQVQPPLPSVTEQFELGSPAPPKFGVRFMAEPDLRCWFLDVTGNRLLQVQRDRFIHNWRRLTGSETYPRYPSIRATMEAEWIRFCDFLASEQLGAPDVNQCEVTYVNHIEYDNGWKGYGELNRVIAPWSGTHSGAFLPDPERANMEVHYLLPNNLGRLHVAVEPVIRARDAREVLQLALTARGAPKSSSLEDIFRWLDLGREWIVKGFADFTEKDMHKIWERQA